MSDKETSLVKVNPISASLEAADKLGSWMAKSGMFGCKNIEQAQVLAVTCITEKITPLEFAQTYDIIEGKPAMKSAAMLAKFVVNGGDYDVVERGDERCRIKFTWREKVTGFEFTIEEAKQAGLVRNGSAWTKYPRNMLFSRCVANYLRTYCPEHFAGHYTDEELRGDVTMPIPAPKASPKPMFDNSNGKTVDIEVKDIQTGKGGHQWMKAEVVEKKPAKKKATDTPANTETTEREQVPIAELYSGLGVKADELVFWIAETQAWISETAMEDKDPAEILNTLKPGHAASLRKKSAAVVKAIKAWQGAGEKKAAKGKGGKKK